LCNLELLLKNYYWKKKHLLAFETFFETESFFCFVVVANRFDQNREFDAKWFCGKFGWSGKH
jgi:hypothetical protein